MDNNLWSKISWRNYPVWQQPAYSDIGKLDSILQEISRLPALVYAGETRQLQSELGAAMSGDTFVLQCGDCAEEFRRCTGPTIHSLLKVILQMSIVISFATGKRVINVGRLAGQYAKPRSNDFESLGGKEIPVYRGDMVNSLEPSANGRTPDPDRLLQGYFRSAATLNLVRAFTNGGYGSLKMAESWHQDFTKYFPRNDKYSELILFINKVTSVLRRLGVEQIIDKLMGTIFVSHEALLLGYEEALTRIDTTTSDWYDTSAHMLWIGNRTRQVEGGHVEFLRGVHNPIGVKIGPDHDPDEILRLFEILNPENTPGRLAFIVRFGKENIAKFFPPLIKRCAAYGFNVVWMCDPMHGNTFKTNAGIKTRHFDDILHELRQAFEICATESSCLGGAHLEITGEIVTECLGGPSNLTENQLEEQYLTACDPRLNVMQALELSFEIAEFINQQATRNKTLDVMLARKP